MPPENRRPESWKKSHEQSYLPFDWGQGNGSPFERLYEMDAKLLLLGVGTNRATMLHYAETLVPHGRRKTRHFPIIQNGKRIWINAPDAGDDLNTHFPAIGERYFTESGDARTGNVGQARSHLASTKGLTDFAKEYLSEVLKHEPA